MEQPNFASILSKLPLKHDEALKKTIPLEELYEIFYEGKVYGPVHHKEISSMQSKYDVHATSELLVRNILEESWIKLPQHPRFSERPKAEIEQLDNYSSSSIQFDFVDDENTQMKIINETLKKEQAKNAQTSVAEGQVDVASQINGKRYYLVESGQKSGPYSFDEIERKLTLKTLNFTDMISINNGDSWQRIFENKEFDRRTRTRTEAPPSTPLNEQMVSNAKIEVTSILRLPKAELEKTKEAIVELAFIGNNKAGDLKNVSNKTNTSNTNGSESTISQDIPSMIPEEDPSSGLKVKEVFQKIVFSVIGLIIVTTIVLAIAGKFKNGPKNKNIADESSSEYSGKKNKVYNLSPSMNFDPVTKRELPLGTYSNSSSSYDSNKLKSNSKNRSRRSTTPFKKTSAFKDNSTTGNMPQEYTPSSMDDIPEIEPAEYFESSSGGGGGEEMGSNDDFETVDEGGGFVDGGDIPMEAKPDTFEQSSGGEDANNDI